jgi:hypothetical protein
MPAEYVPTAEQRALVESAQDRREDAAPRFFGILPFSQFVAVMDKYTVSKKLWRLFNLKIVNRCPSSAHPS